MILIPGGGGPYPCFRIPTEQLIFFIANSSAWDLCAITNCLVLMDLFRELPVDEENLRTKIWHWHGNWQLSPCCDHRGLRPGTLLH
jgi:hypothetical protein